MKLIRNLLKKAMISIAILTIIVMVLVSIVEYRTDTYIITDYLLGGISNVIQLIIPIVAVILLPIFVTNDFGTGSPAFCKWICPAGTLGGGLPLVILNKSFRDILGFLFHWKVSILIIILAASVFVYRPFCKYLCPLGAFYGFFNRVSLFKMNVDDNKCTNCGVCTKKCKMGVEVVKNINSHECIRCGDCKRSCAHNAIEHEFKFNNNKGELK